MTNKVINQELLIQALAWFIVNDETNAGGDWEQENYFWLQNRRHAYQFFGGWKETVKLAEEFSKSIPKNSNYSEDYENEWMEDVRKYTFATT